MQLQKLVRPLRTLQYNTLSPQSVESIYNYGNNGEPSSPHDFKDLLYTADVQKNLFFYKRNKIDSILI